MALKGFILSPVQKVETLSLLYKNLWPANPEGTSIFVSNDTGTLSDEGPGFILFFIEMHRLTNDVQWLSRAEAFIKHLFTVTDVKHVGYGTFTVGAFGEADAYVNGPLPYYLTGEPFIGWSRKTSDNKRVITLGDNAKIAAAVAWYCNYIRDEGLLDYYDEADVFAADITAVLSAFDDNWAENKTLVGINDTVAGTWWAFVESSADGTLSEVALPYADVAVMTKAMFYMHRLNNDSTFKTKVDLNMQHITSSYTNGCGRSVTASGGYLWTKTPVSLSDYPTLKEAMEVFRLMWVLNKYGHPTATIESMSAYGKSITSMRLDDFKLGTICERLDCSGELASIDYSYVAYMMYYNRWVTDIERLVHDGISKNFVYTHPTHLYAHALRLSLKTKDFLL